MERAHTGQLKGSTNLKILHLDLKGAPWKVPYLEKVILAAKKWGATGILLEWEDTFPYTRELVDIGSIRNCGGDSLYSLDEVYHIIKFAEENGIEVIQLIQTIGHMEFVLKHPAFRSLREAPRSAAVLCPSKTDSVTIVKMMLQQALDVQPGAKYLHIGADEVWHTAVCQDCHSRATTSKHKAATLYLEHIKEIALFIKQQRPNLTVLMWDDMLRGICVDAIKEFQLGELVEPVLWHYNAKDCFNIDPNLWEMYKHLFPRVWAGSAFKGANGSCQIMSPVNRYVSNHEAWVREFKNYESAINFAGIILTGWSRYDHFATLCELLPVSLPSLASCLKLLTSNDGVNSDSECVISESLPSRDWPGQELAGSIHSFVALRDRCHSLIHGDLVATWLNPWQLETNYVNPVQIEGIFVTSDHLLKELTPLENEIATYLHSITGKRSTEEWIHTLVTPIKRRLVEIRDVASAKAISEPEVTPRI